MNTIFLSKEWVARVWLDDAPVHKNFNSFIAARAIQKKENAVYLRYQKVKIELLLPLGGRFLYGLLGCELSFCGFTHGFRHAPDHWHLSTSGVDRKVPPLVENLLSPRQDITVSPFLYRSLILVPP